MEQAAKETSEDVVNKARLAAAGRAKKGKNYHLPYLLWIGGSLGAIVLAIVMLVVSPDKGPSSILVNDKSLISQLNRNAKIWRAGASSFFEGWTLGDVRSLAGVSISAMGGAVAPCVVQEVVVPENFDSRQKWPQCFHNPIYTMGNCTASWAIATASALGSRFCISNPTEYGDLMLSPQQLLSCDALNRGCDGGDIDMVWTYVQREGLVSEKCFPYQADSNVDCRSRCTNEAAMRAASHCVLTEERSIQKEIMTNGPVVAAMFLADDILVYRSGVYVESTTAKKILDSRRQPMIHAVKIIGWGAEHGRTYWWLENSWGEDWGENGYAKVLRGVTTEKKDGVIAESYVLAGTPLNAKVGNLASDLDEDTEAEDDLEAADGDADDALGPADSEDA